MPYYALDYLPYQYLRKAKRGRSGRSAVLGQAVKSAGIRNGNVPLFSKITHCEVEKDDGSIPENSRKFEKISENFRKLHNCFCSTHKVQRH